MVNYICIDSKGIVITTNSIASLLDLQAIEKYIKSTSSVDTKQVQSLWLSQSKSYLKIISILYLSKVTNTCITSEDTKNFLKNTHIFNNIVLASKSRIIKVSSKSDMAIIWIDIQNAQSSSKAKSLMNWKFNIGRFIATVCGANMNLSILQCKNCWK